MGLSHIPIMAMKKNGQEGENLMVQFLSSTPLSWTALDVGAYNDTAATVVKFEL